MKSVAVVCLLASVLLASCVSPAKPTAPGAAKAAAATQALDGIYDVEFHSTWFGPLRTTMTAQAVPAGDGKPASFKANTRPGIAWDLVGGVQQVLGPILAPYIFPQGMLLTWQSTMPDPASGTVGEGRIGISKVGPFGAKTRMKDASGPVEIVFTDGRVIAVMAMHRRQDQLAQVPPTADYAKLTDDIRDMTASRLFDPAIVAKSEFKEYFSEVREAAAKTCDDLEYSFAGGLAWRKYQSLPLPLAYRPVSEESRRVMGQAAKGVEPITFKMDEKTGIATIEVLAFEDAAAVGAIFAKMLEAKPKGLILDIRSCTGFDLSALAAARWLIAGPVDAGLFVDAAHRNTLPDATIPRDVIDSAQAIARAHSRLKEQGCLGLQVLAGPKVYSGPVAVLTLGRTRSSAEVLAAVLKSRPSTRYFGAKTANRPRITFERELPQGYVIRIPEYDWRGPGEKTIGTCEVRPDERCSKDQAPVKAQAWLLKIAGGA
ncbi:MAG: S41 family peptidase [Planctomycetota bacterium]|nr:S41 family peptidase [Planctomycetota bacterium]